MKVEMLATVQVNDETTARMAELTEAWQKFLNTVRNIGEIKQEHVGVNTDGQSKEFGY